MEFIATVERCLAVTLLDSDLAPVAKGTTSYAIEHALLSARDASDPQRRNRHHSASLAIPSRSPDIEGVRDVSKQSGRRAHPFHLSLRAPPASRGSTQHRLRPLQAVHPRHTGPLTANEVETILVHDASHQVPTVRESRVSGHVIGLPDRASSDLYPAFRLDRHQHRVNPVVAYANCALHATVDPYGIASWWLTATELLDGNSPTPRTDLRDTHQYRRRQHPLLPARRHVNRGR